LATIALAFASFLLGSVPFAVLVSKAFGLPDPRSYGSGNPGATNVLRTGRKAAAAFTLLGDAGKGFAAVLIAKLLAPRLGVGDAAVAWCALGVFLGHLYPVFLRFRGGKGVATAFGALLALSWKLGAMLALVWLAVAALSRLSSVAAIAAAVAAPLSAYALFGWHPYLWATLVMAVLLIWRHRTNIRNLMKGNESRIGAPNPPSTRQP
jgi:glycerol-3-phosphate acyltransferase PlsY